MTNLQRRLEQRRLTNLERRRKRSGVKLGTKRGPYDKSVKQDKLKLSKPEVEVLRDWQSVFAEFN